MFYIWNLTSVCYFIKQIMISCTTLKWRRDIQNAFRFTRFCEGFAEHRKWYDMTWHDMIWYDMISYHIISYTISYFMPSHMPCHIISYRKNKVSVVSIHKWVEQKRLNVANLETFWFITMPYHLNKIRRVTYWKFQTMIMYIILLHFG